MEMDHLLRKSPSWKTLIQKPKAATTTTSCSWIIASQTSTSSRSGLWRGVSSSFIIAFWIHVLCIMFAFPDRIFTVHHRGFIFFRLRVQELCRGFVFGIQQNRNQNIRIAKGGGRRTTELWAPARFGNGLLKKKMDGWIRWILYGLDIF